MDATSTPESTSRGTEPQAEEGLGNEQPNGESQTASEFINSQLQLEADAREALPYNFDRCTQPLGPLRQSIFSCLTCNPAPAVPSKDYKPAGVCYSCSIACHGEHTLVELFNRRNFICDCGTTRLPTTSPCTLRIDPASGMKGPVHSQTPSEGNTYNQNFQNRFCGCGEWYDPHQQKGTMYQCIGLATELDGGCGEDWWHPECLLDLPRDWFLTAKGKPAEEGPIQDVTPSMGEQSDEEEEHPVPPGFPHEDQIDTLICYKCTNVNPWIKRYGGSAGFLSLLYHKPESAIKVVMEEDRDLTAESPSIVKSEDNEGGRQLSMKRKAEGDDSDAEIPKKRRLEECDPDTESGPSKKSKSEEIDSSIQQPLDLTSCRMAELPDPPAGLVSLIASDEDFRSHFCRCSKCYPSLSKHPQLLEEEESYEPPLSEDDDDAEGAGSVGTGSLLDRGEAALSNVDRVRAIEGVMVYNHLKDKVKSFLQPFAESGKAVGAEDIKAYFEKLRGDAEAIRAAGGAAIATGDGDDGGGDGRKEQSGY